MIKNASDEDATEYFGLVLEGREDVTVDASQADERQLFDAILSATFRVDVVEIENGKSKTVYRDMSVSQVLDEEMLGGAEVTLEAYGIKKAKVGECDGIFICPQQVAGKLLKGSMWGQLNIGDILQRIPGAKKNIPRRLAGTQMKGVWIPWSRYENEHETETE